MARKSILTGAIVLFLAVAFGAFAAHILKAQIDEIALQNFQTGVRYQFYHGLAILVLGLNAKKISGWHIICNLLILGILFFCGSLYLLAFKAFLPEIVIKIAGPITPIGGLCFLAGWAYLIFIFWNKRISDQ